MKSISGKSLAKILEKNRLVRNEVQQVIAIDRRVQK